MNLPVMGASKRGKSLSVFRWPLGLLSLLLLVGRLSASEFPEFDIKAAYLFNFAKFVDWPPRAFSSPGAPLVIGVFGSDPFGGTLDRITQGEVVHGHKLVVRHCRTLGELKDCCQIVFIPKGESDRVDQALAAVRGGAVLTVGDSDRFISQGGMIRFIMAGNNVRFQINAEAAQQEALTISSRLLRLSI